MKKEIAILGGAFDPITIGHIKLAQFVINERHANEVWLTPCCKHMYGKKLVDSDKRIQMCKVATRHEKAIKVFDYEIEHNLNGETYAFINKLQNDPLYCKDYIFSLIIGMDNANSFHKWINNKELEKTIRFIVVSREGVDQDHNNKWYLNSPHVYLQAGDKIPNISSTIVRDLISKYYCHPEMQISIKNNILKHISDEQFSFILDNNLYKKDLHL